MNISKTLYQELCEVIPGGVSSPFRSFDLVGGTARVLVKGRGSRIWDADGREYIDLCCGWGPLTLGHCHPAITEAVRDALEDGVLFGAPTPWELELAQGLKDALPSLEMLRFVNSGAEAVQSCLRVARSATGRTKIVKFEGGYHGHVPPLDAAGEEAQRMGGPLALGATPGAVSDTLIAEFNNLESVMELFRVHSEDIAAVILEPVTGSIGVVEAEQAFLERVSDLCRNSGSLLIFDEVLTGFRVALGGAQSRCRIVPDLTCLGKAVAGGLPIGVYGGKKELMQRLAPLGPVYQAGTFCANPVSVRAGIAALREYRQPGFFEQLSERTSELCQGLKRLFPDILAPHVGGMFSVGFGPTHLRNHQDASQLCPSRFAKFFHAVLEVGIYLPPSTWDAAGLSIAHDGVEVREVLTRLETVRDSAAF